MTFARWLSRQQDREGWIGDLARAAKKDPRFPWTGEPLDMQARIRSTLGDDAEALHAFRAALDEWHGGPYPLNRDALSRSDEERRQRVATDDARLAAEAEAKRLARKARDRARRVAKS